MRRIVVAFIALILPTAVIAQDGVPPRFQAVAKDTRFRLTRILGSPEMHPAVNATTAFSADGRRAVYIEDLTSGGDDNPAFRSRLFVWDVDKKGWPREIDIDGMGITSLSLSADGKKALLSGWILPEKKKLPLPYVSWWDLETSKQIKGFITGEQAMFTAALAPDEASVIVGTGAELKQWNLQTGKESLTYGGKETSATAIAYLPGGKQFLSSTFIPFGKPGAKPAAALQLWNVGAAKPVRSYESKNPRPFIGWLAASKDGKRFASADFDEQSLTVWDTAAGKEVGTLKFEKRTIEEVLLAAALADDGKTVISVWGKANPAPDDFECAKIYAWDADAGKVRWSQVASFRGRVPLVIDGNRILIGGGPNPFGIWSLAEGKHMVSWTEHKGAVTSIAVRADGYILSAGAEPVIFVWGKGLLQNKIAVDKSAVTALTMSRDGQSWLRAGADLTMRHTPRNNGRSVYIVSGHKGPITSVAYSNDGTWACSGSGDRSVKTWKLKGGSEIATITGHSEGINAVAVSPDDRWIATASDDATVRLWPVKDGKPDPDRDPVVLEKHKKAVTCLAFSPDGKRLISGSQDQTMIAWDWQKGSMDFIMPGHKNWITSIVFLDATTMLSTSDDLTLCAWDLATGKEMSRIDFGVVGDCPRCLAPLAPDRFVVGTSSWLIYEFQLLPDGKTKGGKGSSK